MKKIILAAIALSLLSGTAAVAQRGDSNNQTQNAGEHRNDSDRGSRNDRGQYNRDQNDGGRFDGRNNDHPRWSRGDRLPDQYRQNQFIVGDWRQHNLGTPQRGYHWVRNDYGQYLLVSIGSGIILDVVSQDFYRDDYSWSRGERLSGGYLENRYVVSDWRGNRLHRPARGYHWVRINNQMMLTAIATGVIAEIAINGR